MVIVPAQNQTRMRRGPGSRGLRRGPGPGAGAAGSGGGAACPTCPLGTATAPSQAPGPGVVSDCPNCPRGNATGTAAGTSSGPGTGAGAAAAGGCPGCQRGRKLLLPVEFEGGGPPGVNRTGEVRAEAGGTNGANNENPYLYGWSMSYV